MPECKGHESTIGPIGTTVYCDGSCNLPKKYRKCSLELYAKRLAAEIRDSASGAYLVQNRIKTARHKRNTDSIECTFFDNSTRLIHVEDFEGTLFDGHGRSIVACSTIQG